MGHPLIELASDREVKQAAAFRKAAQGLTGAGLAASFEQEKQVAPRLHEAGRRYFVRRSGKPALERRAGRDEEHLSAALVRHCREGGAGIPLPDEGELDLFDYRVRIKATRADDPETKGIGRIDLLGTVTEGRIAVVQLRYVAPTATRCAVGDTPLRSLLQGLAYTAIIAANRGELESEIGERFERSLGDEPPALILLATPRYWELCRKREAQKGAAWIKELERLSGEIETDLGVTVRYLSLELQGDPGWDYAEDGPVLSAAPRLRPAWEATAGRVRPRARPRPKPAAPVEEVVEPDLSRPVRVYGVKERFEAGDRIQHPTLGLGVVQGSAGAGKIRVRFDDKTSLLVHER